MRVFALSLAWTIMLKSWTNERTRLSLLLQFFFTIYSSFLDLSPLIVIYHLINATAVVLLHQGGKRITVLFEGQIST